MLIHINPPDSSRPEICPSMSGTRDAVHSVPPGTVRTTNSPVESPTQIRPFPSSASAQTGTFSLESTRTISVRPSGDRRASPAPVPIHRLPARSSRSAHTCGGRPNGRSIGRNAIRSLGLLTTNTPSSVPAQTRPARSSWSTLTRDEAAVSPTPYAVNKRGAALPLVGCASRSAGSKVATPPPFVAIQYTPLRVSRRSLGDGFGNPSLTP